MSTGNPVERPQDTPPVRSSAPPRNTGRGYTPSRVAPDLSKTERRAAGRVAAAKRKAQARRRRTLKQASVLVAVLAVLGLVAWLTGVFGPGAGKPAATGTPTAPAATNFLPPGADPALATKPAVTAGQGTVTELKKTTLITGTGAAVQVGQNLTFNYVGVSYSTGQEFGSSWGSGEPATAMLAQGSLIDGWVQGLPGVTIGSRVQLDIPQALAYPNPEPGQPSGALRFVIDVLDAS